jgi:hypothetical protein
VGVNGIGRYAHLRAHRPTSPTGCARGCRAARTLWWLWTLAIRSGTLPSRPVRARSIWAARLCTSTIRLRPAAGLLRLVGLQLPVEAVSVGSTASQARAVGWRPLGPRAPRLVLDAWLLALTHDSQLHRPGSAIGHSLRLIVKLEPDSRPVVDRDQLPESAESDVERAKIRPTKARVGHEHVR